jgi:signal peptidase I
VQGGAWLALTLWILLPPGWFTVLLGFLILLGVLFANVLHAGVVAHRAGPTYELRPYNRWYSYLAAFVALALWQQASFSLAKNKVAQAFRIPSPAMEPTMLVGDFLWVARFPTSVAIPQQSAIVVFVSVEDSTPTLHIVKRVIGMPGDTLRMVRDTAYRNGKRLDEPYTVPSSGGVTDPPEYLRRIRAWQLDHYIGADPQSYQPTTHD